MESDKDHSENEEIKEGLGEFDEIKMDTLQIPKKKKNERQNSSKG